MEEQDECTAPAPCPVQQVPARRRTRFSALRRRLGRAEDWYWYAAPAWIALIGWAEDPWEDLGFAGMLVWMCVGLSDAGERALRHLRHGQATEEDATGAIEAQDEPARARRALERAVQQAEQSAEQLPTGALASVRELAGALRALLSLVEQEHLDQLVAHEVAAVAGDLLPTAIQSYLRLPPEVARESSGAAGAAPAQDLLEQLELLREGVRRLQRCAHAPDVERLATQRRFLESKFGGSDLDLR